MNKNGIIVKSVGGFYYLETADGVIECRARGKFRNTDIVPVVGDYAQAEYDESSKNGVITHIHERKNFFRRPPLANVDVMVFVVSVCEPAPSPSVLDKLIALAEYKGIEPVLVITKEDLAKDSFLFETYSLCGFKIFRINKDDTSELSEFKAFLANKLSAFVGNSGVGKSTLLNAVDPDFQTATGEISKKLGRGRHTTRQVSLYKLPGGGYIADTPGFSSVEYEKYEIIKKDELAQCFREFRPFLGKCRFLDCSHTNEKGCEVISAVERGEIPESRHKQYMEMYETAKKYKEWEHNKNG